MRRDGAQRWISRSVSRTTNLPCCKTGRWRIELERKVRAASRSMVDASTVIAGLGIRSRTVGTGCGCGKKPHYRTGPLGRPPDKDFTTRAEIQERKMRGVRWESLENPRKLHD